MSLQALIDAATGAARGSEEGRRGRRKTIQLPTVLVQQRAERVLEGDPRDTVLGETVIEGEAGADDFGFVPDEFGFVPDEPEAAPEPAKPLPEGVTTRGELAEYQRPGATFDVPIPQWARSVGDVALGPLASPLGQDIARAALPLPVSVAMAATGRAEESGPVVSIPGRLNPEAAVRGAQQAAELDTADEQAGLRAAASGALERGNLSELSDDYAQARDEYRLRERAATSASPESAALGEVAGTLPWFAAPIAGGRTAAQRIAVQGLEGTVAGGLQQFGASEGETAAEVAGDTGGGMVVGGGFGVAGSGLGESFGAVGRRMADVADRRAAVAEERALMRRLRAIFGGERPGDRQWRQLVGTREGRLDRLREMVPRLERQSRGNMGNLAPVHDTAGEAVRVTARDIDERAAALGRPGGIVSGPAVALRLRQYADSLEASAPAGGSSAADAVRRIADQWEEGGTMSMQQGWQSRRALNNPADWNVDTSGRLSAAREHQRDIYRMINEELREAASSVNREAANAWSEASRTYSETRPFVDAEENAARRSALNRKIPLTVTIAGAGAFGALTGAGAERGGGGEGFLGAGAGGALATGLAYGALRRREHGISARYHEGVAEYWRRNPELLQRFGDAITSAMQRGPEAIIATDFLLSQREPAYRQMMRRQFEGDEESEE